MELKYKKTLLCLSFGFFVCILTGMFFYGFEVFDFRKPASQFVVYGFLGAGFFSVSRFRLLKNDLLIIPILILINFILIGRDLSLTLMLRDGVFVLALCTSIFIYIKYINAKWKLPLFIRSIILALLNWFTGFLALLLLITTFNPETLDTTAAFFINGTTSTLVGLGLGLGFDLFIKTEDKFFAKDAKQAE